MPWPFASLVKTKPVVGKWYVVRGKRRPIDPWGHTKRTHVQVTDIQDGFVRYRIEIVGEAGGGPQDAMTVDDFGSTYVEEDAS